MSVILAWVVRNWRLVAYAVAALAVLWFLMLVKHWHHDSTVALPEAQAALEAEAACAAGSECAKRVAAAQSAAAERQRVADLEVLDGYQKGLQAVADYAAAHPAPSVRLCRPTGEPVVRVPDPAGAADGPAPGGDVQVQASGDIGQRLFDLADDADRQSVKLRALQDWNTSLAQGQ
jgi:hypothetical protein